MKNYAISNWELQPLTVAAESSGPVIIAPGQLRLKCSWLLGWSNRSSRLGIHKQTNACWSLVGVSRLVKKRFEAVEGFGLPGKSGVGRKG